jgi:hypothetical protein
MFINLAFFNTDSAFLKGAVEKTRSVQELLGHASLSTTGIYTEVAAARIACRARGHDVETKAWFHFLDYIRLFGGSLPRLRGGTALYAKSRSDANWIAFFLADNHRGPILFFDGRSISYALQGGYNHS